MVITYEINGITLIVNRTINLKRKEELKYEVFQHFMNKALDKLEEQSYDADGEFTEQIE